MMKKKVFAFLTALACMAGCIPVSVFAADPWDEGALYRVLQVDDIGGLVLEQLDGGLYVLSNWYGQIDAIWAEQEMAEVGDILQLSAPEEIATSEPGILLYTEETPLELVNLGSVEEIGERMPLTITEENGYAYKLTDAQGAQYAYRDNTFLLEGSQAGDIVNFWVYGEYGVMPVAASSDFEHDYYLMVDTDSMLAYRLQEPDLKYQLDFGTLGCGVDLDAILEGQKPLEDGDVLYISRIESVAEVYPCCIHIAEDAIVRNMGSMEEIAEKKTLVITKDGGLSFTLQDAEDAIYRYDDSLNQYLENGGMDEFTAGDSVDFWVYEDRVVAPIGAAETPIFEPKMFVVVDRYEYTNGDWDFIIMDNRGGTYTLSEEQIAEYLVKGEKYPEYGDILGLQGQMTATEEGGTNWMSMNFLSPETNDWDAPGVMKNYGSVIENGETAVFEVVWKDKYHSMVELKDADGEKHYINMNYQEGDLLYDIQIGSEIEMYTYQGKPKFPTKQTTGFFAVVTHIGYDENNAPWRYLLSNNVMLYAEDAARLLDGRLPVLGDVLEIGCDSMDPTEIANLVFDGEYEDFIRNHGSAMEYYGKTANLTVKEISDYTVHLTSAEGGRYHYCESPYLHDYQFTSSIMLGDVREGDVLTFAMHQNKPVYLSDVMPLGDYNSDGSLDILDVIGVNRRILGVEKTPARAVDTLGQADFNGNGKIDADDSLGMLKRIVGLET